VSSRYWGLHIFKTLKAPIDWAPFSVGQDHALARISTTKPLSCYPTAAQLEYGAHPARGPGQRAQPLRLPPTFELANPSSGRVVHALRRSAAHASAWLNLVPAAHAPNYSFASVHFGEEGPPLARACRQPTLSIDRNFKCPGTSLACEGTEMADPLSLAATAGRMLETTKDWSRAVKGCPAFGSGTGSLGGEPCAQALKELWSCLRVVANISESNNCTSLLVKRTRAHAFLPGGVKEVRLG